MAKKFVVVDTRFTEYSAGEVAKTMTVGDLIKRLSKFDKNLPVVAGNNKCYHGIGSHMTFEGWMLYSPVGVEEYDEVEEEQE